MLGPLLEGKSTMCRILAGIVLAVMLTGCDAENASDEKAAEAEKTLAVEKASEDEKASEAEKAFEEGAAAYKSGDYATALRLLRPLAELGAVPAQMIVAAMQQDYAEALKWYRLAAEQGVAQAQTIVGKMYLQGNGVFPDDTEAVKWFRSAAEQGDAEAQNNLGVMYASGKGVPQDYVQALMWFSLADLQSPNSDQPKDRNDAVKNRERAASQMTPEQIAEAQKLAREWKPPSAAQ